MSKFVDKIKLPTEIAENETGLYHVVIVEASFNQAKLEADYKSRVQKYNDRSWLAIKDRLKQIGHTNVYVMHDPTIKAVESEKTAKNTKTAKANKTKTETKTETGAGADGDAGTGTGAGADAGDDAETPQDKRQALIEKAKGLGYAGALNVKNSIFEEFIESAETNGAGAEADGDE